MLTLTQVKNLLKEYGLRPNKRLGQNFLIDPNIARKIINAARLEPADAVMEVGAGVGNITADIAQKAGRVVAVEFDKGLCAVLRDRLAGWPGIEVFCGDILKFDFALLKRGTAKVVGNLPYYITTPILERLIENRPAVRSAVLMVQKEVGERLLAGPGLEAYSALSCYAGFYARTEFLGIVRRTSFFPQPKVDSALLRLTFLEKGSVAVNDETLLFEVIRAAFNQRRKTILTSLGNKGIKGLKRQEIKAVLERARIDAQRRPETLSLHEFARISDELKR